LAIQKMAKSATDQMVGFAKARYTGKKAAGNIAGDLARIARMFNTERKQVDTKISTTNVYNSAPVVSHVVSPAQGTTGSTRDGDSIKVVRIDANLQFGFGSGTSNSLADQRFNYFLVQWLKTPSTGGSTPFAIADFLDVDAAGNYTPMSFPNNDLNENYKVLIAGDIRLDVPFATAANNTMTRTVSHSLECSLHQTFTGAAATTIVDNALFWVIVGSNGINAGGSSYCLVSTRLWYVDN